MSDSVLTDDTLEALSLAPSDAQITAEDVLLTLADARVCVARTGASTIILDGGEALMAAADEGRLGLPDTVHFAATVSTVDFSEFAVLTNSETVRYLRYEDGETLIDVGEPVSGESDWLITPDDSESPAEIDGDILIQRRPEMAGLSPGVDIFALTGAGFFAR